MNRRDRLQEYERRFAGLWLAFALIVVLWGVLARYLALPSKLLGLSEELGRLALVGFTFLAAYYVFQVRGHYKLRVVTDRLTGKSKLLLDATENIVILAVVLALAAGSIVRARYTLGLETLNMQWPAIIFVIPCVIGTTVLGIGCIARLVELVRRHNNV